MDYIIINCPHCQTPIYINHQDFRCHIFRHGVYRSNLKQIDPHMKRQNCLDIVNKGIIYGCAGPFKLLKTEDNNYRAEICDYI